jgi:hypothetical protein
MESNENQQEGGKKVERLAKRGEQRRDVCYKRMKNFHSETRTIVNEMCSQTVNLFI